MTTRGLTATSVLTSIGTAALLVFRTLRATRRIHTAALIALSIACVVATAATAHAAPPSDEPIESAASAPCNTNGGDDFGAVLVRVIVQCRRELGVSDAQLERVDRLALELARQQIRRRADLEVAALELAVLLEPDPNDPARPADAAAAEVKIRDIARIAADGEVARMRAIESLKAVLTAEQRTKLATIMDDPPVDARAPGGGRPGGGAPGGAPGGGRPGGGASGGSPHPRPYPPGGGAEHPRPPSDHRFEGRHDFHPRPWIGVRPWVGFDPFWPGYAYPAPPPVYVVPPTYWYYCASAGAYYPDVQICPEGWVTVVPRAAIP